MPNRIRSTGAAITHSAKSTIPPVDGEAAGDTQAGVHKSGFERGVVSEARWLGGAAEVEEVDPEEGDGETGEEGEGGYAVGSVESLEEDKGGDERCGGEADVV